MKTYDCEQGSEEWYLLRKGRPTASEFNRILTPARLQEGGKGSHSYLCELVGEMFSLIPEEGIENATNRAIRWGQQTEAEARAWYSMDANVEVARVGFITTDDDRFGCSPDGLVGDDGGLELKCPQPGTHIGYREDNVLPDDYRGQVHGALIITGRQWWDFVSYCPGHIPFRVRVTPDDYTETLRAALDRFHGRLLAAIERHRP